MRVPPLETERLLIRPFVMADSEAVHRVMDEASEGETGPDSARRRADRVRWLQWTVLSYEELALLHQPPYGERAMVLRETGEIIGACGYVPSFDAFGQIPALRSGLDATPGRTSPEFGLFWTVASAFRRRGYATEAARALIAHAFAALGLARIVATTSYDNLPSIGVMRALGMQIERNPLPTPPWLQVVGVSYHPPSAGA